MQETPLSLNGFKFLRTKVDVEEIKKFDSEDQFTSLAIELLKEVGQVTAILSCAYRLDEKNNPRKWTRNEAIIGGLMIRISKLQRGFLDQICQNRLEIAMILFRCLVESLINLTYLLKRSSAEIFNEYIEYSLREEKRLLNNINHNIARRGHELPIEKRMKRSINQTFQTSSFSPTQVNETKWKPWGEKIYERVKSIGMGEAYLGLFGLPSHAVHGNWQDLITYHLEYENSEFSPKTQWSHPRPHPLFAVALLSAEVNSLYLDKIIPGCSEKKQINKLLDDIILRISVVDELHEKFLQK